MFKAGQIFSPPETWDESLEVISSQNILTKPFVQDFVKDRQISIVHRDLLNKSKSPVFFNGIRYEDVDDLFLSEWENYLAVKANKEVVKMEIDRLLEAGAVRKRTKVQAAEEDAGRGGFFRAPEIFCE